MRSSLILSVVLAGCLAAVAGCGSGDGYKYKASTGVAGSEESSGGTGGRSDASAGEGTAGSPNATGGSEEETGGAENGTGGDTPAGGEPGTGGAVTGGAEGTTGGAGGTDTLTGGAGGTGGSESTAGAAGGFSGPEYLASYTFDTTVEGFELLGLSDAAPDTTLEWVNEGSPAPGALQIDGAFTNADATQTITVSLDLDHVDWSTAGQISADIKILEGTVGGYMLFIQTSPGWAWVNSPWTSVTSLGDDWTTITWDLSGVEQLNDVVRVGLQWHSGSGSTESVSFQLDSIVVTERQEQGAGGAGGEGGAPGNTGGAEPTAGSAGAAGDIGMAGSAGAAVVNLFPNSGFEDGTTTGWGTWGSGTISATTEPVRTGTSALAHVGRTGDSPARYVVTSLVEAGNVYEFSLWLTIGGAETANAHLTSAIACDGGSTAYEWITGSTSVTEGEWVQLVGSVDLSGCTEVNSVTLYAEGPGADINVYIDDVSLVLVSSGGTGGAGGAGGEGGAGGATGGVAGTGGATGGSDTGGAAGAAGMAGAGGAEQGGAGGAEQGGAGGAEQGGADGAAGAAGSSGDEVPLASYTFDVDLDSFALFTEFGSYPAVIDLDWVSDQGDPDAGSMQLSGTFDDASASQSIMVARTGTLDLTGATTLSARVYVLDGESVGAIQFMIQAGSSWNATFGGWTNISSIGTGWQTISRDISEVADLNDVKRIAIQWTSNGGSTESVAMMIDTITVM